MRMRSGGVAGVRRGGRLGAVLAALTVAGMTVAHPGAERADAAVPGISGRIAFASDRNGTTEIFSVLPDGTGLTQLTSIGGDLVYDPVWSPDGMQLAFVRVEHCFGCPFTSIYVVNADGSGLRSLGGTGYTSEYPAWSPDGTRIAYSTRTDFDVYVMNADGTGKRRLGRGYEPAWSPDGSRIAFYDYFDVHVMNADGTGRTRLARGAYPDWSPDGSQIVFTPSNDPRSSPVQVMNADGSGLRTLGVTTDTRVAWSPDGRHLTYQRNGELFVANADGTGETSVAVGASKEGMTVGGHGPAWHRPVQIVLREQGSAVMHPMPARPYPIPVRLHGYEGIVTDVKVTLQGVTHSRPGDLDVVLVGPGGQAVTLLSDAGGSHAATNVTLTFSDAAPTVVPESGPLASGMWFVSNYGSGDGMPSPAPSPAPYGASLSAFNGTDPNGIWNLYVVDDAPRAEGWIAAWSLDVTTGGVRIVDAAAASPYPSTRTISGYQCCIGEVRVTLHGLTHTWTDDVDVVLVGPGGQAVTLLSDVGGTTGVRDVTVTFLDSASSYLPRTAQIASGWWKPTNYGYGDAMFAPAPNPAPCCNGLSVFAGTNPNGVWRLYVVDDAGRDAGSIRDWSLWISTYSYLPPQCC